MSDRASHVIIPHKDTGYWKKSPPRLGQAAGSAYYPI